MDKNARIYQEAIARRMVNLTNPTTDKVTPRLSNMQPLEIAVSKCSIVRFENLLLGGIAIESIRHGTTIIHIVDESERLKLKNWL